MNKFLFNRNPNVLRGLVGSATVSILMFCCLLILSGGCKAAGAFEIDLQGNWSGESICQVKNSPCHDEKVIYRVSKPDAAGKLTVQMDKIVDNQPEIMGTFDCAFNRKSSVLICEMKNGVWNFNVTENKMEGTLILPDKTLYRRITVTKDK